MSSRQLDTALVLRLVDRLSGPMRTVNGAVGRLTTRLDGAAKAARLAGRGIGQIGRGLRTGALAFAGVGSAATAAAAALTGPAAEFETVMATLTALEGSSEKAGKSFDWVRDFATRTPLQLGDVLDGFRSLKTFGLDPMDGTMQALVDTNARMGGSSEQLNGIILAVGQAWTKQKLQGEEALQLIERGVPVWDLLSEKLGLSTAELQKMSSAGQLGRDEIRLLIEAMGEKSRGAAELQMSTWSGMVSNLKDLWRNFQLEIMNSGLFDWMKEKLAGVLATVNEMAADGRLQALAEKIGQGIQQALEIVWEVLQGIATAGKAAAPWLEWAAEKLGGWTELAAALAAIPFAGTLIEIAKGVAMVGRAFVSLGALLAANPIFLAIGLLAGLVYVVYDNWDRIVEWFDAKFAAVRAAFDEGLVSGLLELLRQFNPVAVVSDALDGLVEYLTGYSLDFSWADLLPEWSWSDIVPDMPSFSIFGGGSDRSGDRALGGSVMAGRLYRVNESGVELFRPAVDGRILPSRPPAPSRSGGGVSVGEIHVHAAPGMSARAVARAVRDEIARIAAAPDRALHDGGGA